MTRLIEALDRASRAILRGDQPSYPAPRPFPDLAIHGARWIHAGRYWFSFRPEPGGYVVTSINFDAANIPGRIDPDGI